VPPGVEEIAASEAKNDEAKQFDEMTQQHTGLILGVAMCSMKRKVGEGKVEDFFLCLPGDDVKLTFPTAGAPPQAVNAQFTVVDFYESKMSEYDSTLAFVPLKELQRLRGMVDPQSGLGAVTSIQIRLKKGADLDKARDTLQARFPAPEYPYNIQTWRDMQGPLLAAVQMETTILNILLFLIIAVAGFGILATFFMIVVEKTKDIGILKSLGAPSSGIAKIFLGYGLSLGIVGSGVGMVLGLLFVVYINQIADLLGWITGTPVFDPEIYYFSRIPTIIDAFTIVWISLGAMLIAVLASVLPAMRAARLHPVEALRYE
jgi:lipoprotein-releasing system permease protein